MCHCVPLSVLVGLTVIRNFLLITKSLAAEAEFCVVSENSAVLSKFYTLVTESKAQLIHTSDESPVRALRGWQRLKLALLCVLFSMRFEHGKREKARKSKKTKKKPHHNSVQIILVNFKGRHHSLLLTHTAKVSMLATAKVDDDCLQLCTSFP